MGVNVQSWRQIRAEDPIYVTFRVTEVVFICRLHNTGLCIDDNGVKFPRGYSSRPFRSALLHPRSTIQYVIKHQLSPRFLPSMEAFIVVL